MRQADGSLTAGEQEAAIAAGSTGLRTALVQSGQSSVTAIELALIQARGDDDLARLQALADRLHQLRPFSSASHTHRGMAAVRAGDLHAARDAFHQAAALRPHDATCAFNEVRISLQIGAAAGAVEAATSANGRGALDRARLEALARDAQLEGWVGPATVRSLLELGTGPLETDDLIGLSVETAEQGGREATSAAWASLAMHLVARGQAKGGDVENAVLNYRRAWAASLAGGRGGSPLLRLELAAAERRAGHAERAADLLGQEVGSGLLALDLPAWAVESLRE